MTEEQIYELSLQAYIYGYPLVLMEITKQVYLEQGTPLNQFRHAKTFPSPKTKIVVRPNVDTLYSLAWVDLSIEPLILSVPNTEGRFYLLQLLDIWTETLAVIGARTTGTQAGHFAIVGPHWQGTLPPEITPIPASSHLVWIIGRIQTNGKDDYAQVHRLQKGYQLTPLSHWGRVSAPAAYSTIRPFINLTPPPQRIAQMEGITFFKTLAALLKIHPPKLADASLLKELEAIAIRVGEDFDEKSLDAITIQALNRAVQEGPKQLTAYYQKDYRIQNGWRFRLTVGNYGTAYRQRAAIALLGLGALPAEEAIYGSTNVDEQGQLLHGSKRYRLHFDSSHLPPVQAFWCITLYTSEGFFAPNPINRYAIGDRDPLVFNADGSLDIEIQSEPPEPDQAVNWLPSPLAAFNLLMRLYWPQPEILHGQWQPPTVRCLDPSPNRDRLANESTLTY
jgi:hypothetical protein